MFLILTLIIFRYSVHHMRFLLLLLLLCYEGFATYLYMFGCNYPTSTSSNQNMLGLAIGTLSEEIAVICTF